LDGAILAMWQGRGLLSPVFPCVTGFNQAEILE
jgi:hypothetical protein